jgi:autoinducer 2-degrading protein
MIKILAEFTVAEENIEKAKSLFEQLACDSLEEDGCLDYSVNQVSRQENVFILQETFMSREAQDFHKLTVHYNEILKGKLEPMIIDKKVRFLI